MVNPSPVSRRRTDKGTSLDRHRDEINAWAAAVAAALGVSYAQTITVAKAGGDYLGRSMTFHKVTGI